MKCGGGPADCAKDGGKSSEATYTDRYIICSREQHESVSFMCEMCGGIVYIALPDVLISLSLL